MPTRNIKDADPKLKAAYEKTVIEWGKLHPSFPKPFLTCVYRSSQEQDALYDQGRTTKGPKVTNARGGQSKHNIYPSHAIDIAFKNGKVIHWEIAYFKEFARIMVTVDSTVKWGGHFKSIKDNPHFEI